MKHLSDRERQIEMQYTITHTCGHTETAQIYGTNSHGERERKASWMESKPCRECQRAAQTAEAKTQASSLGLPTLTGSEKQVAWAESIRAAAVQRLAQRLDEQARIAPAGHEHEMVAARAAAAVIMAKHADARWWIDHRGGELSALAADYETAYAAALAAGK